ncbi:MAG: hypothetical protein ACRDAU_16495 [Clostridium sp.]
MNISLINTNPLSIAIILGKKIGLFKNLNLSIIEDFKFIGENPYIEGKSDLMIGDITFFFYALEKGKESIITSTLTRTIHLVIKEGVGLNEKNLKIGVSRNGLFKLLLEKDLKEKLNEPKIVWIDNTFERIEALKKGEIQGLIAINPFVDIIEYEEIGQVRWSLRDSDKKLVMYCFDKDYYENNIREIQEFHFGVRKASKIYNNMAFEEKEKFLGEDMNYIKEYQRKFVNFTFEEEEDFKEEDFNLCKEWMIREGKIEKDYKYEEYVKSLGK